MSMCSGGIANDGLEWNADQITGCANSMAQSFGCGTLNVAFCHTTHMKLAQAAGNRERGRKSVAQ